MKYKAGDKARVRSDLVEEQTYGNCAFVENMIPLRNKIVTISRVHYDISRYQLEENLTGEYWTDEMLEDVEEEFKLPEKWCIRLASKEINDAVNSIKLWPYGNLTWSNRDNYTNHYIGFDGCYAEGLVSGNYIEITFDQFKKYVLKESESIPKFESKFVKGKWYKNPKWWSSPQDFCKFSGEFSGCLIGYTDKIIKGVPYFGSTGYWCNGDLCIEASAEEIQQYLPENHPDKIKKRTKKVEDLKYPDVVHCSSKEQHDKINLIAGLTVYEGDKWYLTGAHGRDSKPYDELGGKGYVNYEFSDIIFPEEKVETKSMLSKEELLAEAKRRYPIGTKYKAASDDSSDIFVLSSNNWSDSLLDDVVHAEHGKGCLYYKGDWAEIISEPTIEQHSKYVECIGLEETDVSFWSNNFTIGEIYLVEEYYGTTAFRINGTWCDKSQFKPSTKEAFDKQGKSVVEKKEELVQTGLSQIQACDSCKYTDDCDVKGFWCKASGGQHYPKDYIPGSRTGGYMDGVPVSERLIIHTGNIGLPRGIYNIPVEPKDCFESDEIYVPIIKTEVKQIKL